VFHTDRSIVSYPDDGRNQKIEEYLNTIQEIPTAVFATYFGAMIGKMAYDFYQKNYSKFARECKNLTDREKSICMLNAKARAKKMEIGKLQSGISKCSKAKNPEKCKQTLSSKLSQATATLKLSMQRMSQLKKGSR